MSTSHISDPSGRAVFSSRLPASCSGPSAGALSPRAMMSSACRLGDLPALPVRLAPIARRSVEPRPVSEHVPIAPGVKKELAVLGGAHAHGAFGKAEGGINPDGVLADSVPPGCVLVPAGPGTRHRQQAPLIVDAEEDPQAIILLEAEVAAAHAEQRIGASVPAGELGGKAAAHPHRRRGHVVLRARTGRSRQNLTVGAAHRLCLAREATFRCSEW